MFFTKVGSDAMIKQAVDLHGDSFARDVTINELKDVNPTSNFNYFLVKLTSPEDLRRHAIQA